jgi:hypothetical protein
MPEAPVMSWRKRLMLWSFFLLVLAIAGIASAADMLSRRIEPAIREQMVQYLRLRFDSDVEIGSLHVSMPIGSRLGLLLTGGAQARVAGERISLWHRHHRDGPPLLVVRSFTFLVDLNSLWNRPVRASMLQLQGLRVALPPKSPNDSRQKTSALRSSDAVDRTPVVTFDSIVADGATLTLLPKDQQKQPPEFAFRKLKLESGGPGPALHYTAELTSPKPSGLIRFAGYFGPWASLHPGNTPLTGAYTVEYGGSAVLNDVLVCIDSRSGFPARLGNMAAAGTMATLDCVRAPDAEPLPPWSGYPVTIDVKRDVPLLRPAEATLRRPGLVVDQGVVRGTDRESEWVALDVLFREGFVEGLVRSAVLGTAR